MGIKFAAPVEKSGQKIFDFEYGSDFGEKIKEVIADFAKILVRWNPSDDSETRQVQGERIKTLSEWLDENERKFLLEFLVPATEEQLASVGGDQAKYDSEIRPKLAVQVVEEMRRVPISQLREYLHDRFSLIMDEPDKNCDRQQTAA